MFNSCSGPLHVEVYINIHQSAESESKPCVYDNQFEFEIGLDDAAKLEWTFKIYNFVLISPATCVL
jgi:hypothetical protein